MTAKPSLLAPAYGTLPVGNGRWRERRMPVGTRMFTCP
jgi:hypothetical protein